jgi:myo-inositol-1(or 4)-monophosphatase
MGMPGSSLPDLPDLHRHLLAVIDDATAIALADYRRGQRTSARIIWKDDGSPVTGADLAVDAFLAEALPGGAPLAYHSEERPESWTGGSQPAYVVDPIDGTRNFMDGGDAWCLVIGVVADGIPVAGALAIPARKEVFSAYRGGGAWLNGTRLESLPMPSGSLRVTGPKNTFDGLAARLPERLEGTATVPALAHRLLAPVKNEAELVLARSGSHDWDIAASHAILAECGGSISRLDGAKLTYGLAGEAHRALIAGHSMLLDKIRSTLLTDPT